MKVIEFLPAFVGFSYFIALLGIIHLGVTKFKNGKPIRIWHGLFVNMIFVLFMFMLLSADNIPVDKMSRDEAVMHIFAGLLIYSFFFRLLRGPLFPQG